MARTPEPSPAPDSHGAVRGRGVVSARRICWPVPVPPFLVWPAILAFIWFPLIIGWLQILAGSAHADLDLAMNMVATNLKIALPVVAVLGAYEVFAWFPRRSGRDHAAMWWNDTAAAPCPEIGSPAFADRARELAALVWVSDRCERHDPRFDAQAWVEFFPPGAAPRLILYDLELPRPEDLPEPSEDIDIGPERRLGDLERRIWKRWIIRTALILLVMYGGAGLVVLLLTGMSVGFFAVIAVVPILIELLLIWWVQGLFRRGHRPLRLQSTIASIGGVERTFFWRQKDFTTADSVLIVEPTPRQFSDVWATWGEGFRAARSYREPRIHTSKARGLARILAARKHGEPWAVRATLVRQDGKRLTLKFLGGPDDPGFLDLLSRWSAGLCDYAADSKRQQQTESQHCDSALTVADAPQPAPRAPAAQPPRAREPASPRRSGRTSPPDRC